MEISHLRAFIHIAESGSFSAAASDLHLTQPAISKRIANLEQQFDVRLFDRAGRTVKLTEPGRLLLPKAREILSTLELSKQLIENLGDKVRGNLNLAVTHHIGLHRLPGVLKSFREKYDDVSLQLEFMDSTEACELVESGEAEMAIITLPASPSRNLISTQLWHDRMVFAGKAGHPVMDEQQPNLASLMHHDAILPDRGTLTRKLIDRYLSDNTCQPKVTMETNYLETLRMMSKIGIGWTVLPEIMIDEDEMQIFEFVDCDISRQLGIVRNRQRSLSNAARAMCEALVSATQTTH